MHPPAAVQPQSERGQAAVSTCVTAIDETQRLGLARGHVRGDCRACIRLLRLQTCRTNSSIVQSLVSDRDQPAEDQCHNNRRCKRAWPARPFVSFSHLSRSYLALQMAHQDVMSS
jgi:hypothetical protein